jgi:transposase
MLGIARSTVAVARDRLAAELGWPLPATLSDRVLEAMLYAGTGAQCGFRRKAAPDWTHVHHELRRPGVTLMLLQGECRQREPGGYDYGRWSELYSARGAAVADDAAGASSRRRANVRRLCRPKRQADRRRQ